MSAAAVTALLLCFLGSQVEPTDGAKILLVPNPGYSVYKSLLSIGDELLKKGHQVYIYQLEGFDRVCPHNEKMRTITYKMPPYNVTERMAAFQEIMGKVSISHPWSKAFHSITHLSRSQQTMCETTLVPEKMEELKKENFDFMLIDGSVQNPCYGVIPHVTKVPYGMYGDNVFTWPGLRPFDPKEPTYFSPCTNPMSFVDQALNTVALVYQYLSFLYYVPMQFVNKVAPELSRVQTVDLLFSASVYLLNDRTFLGYVGPEDSKEVQVGCILCTPAKPLPSHIKNFLDKSKEKVIVFAFGGASVTHIPDHISAKFDKALMESNAPVLWKAKSNETTETTMKSPWLPINDVLAHPNVGVIIYHCGRNGFFETVYHGVPVICLPVMYDHPHIGARVESLGVGKTLELGTFTVEQLKNAIQEVLNNPVYKQNAMKLKNKFQNLPETSSEKGAHWVDHVIKHGAGDLQSSPAPVIMYISLFAGLWLAVHILMLLYCCGCFTSKSQTVSKKRVKKD